MTKDDALRKVQTQLQQKACLIDKLQMDMATVMKKNQLLSQQIMNSNSNLPIAKKSALSNSRSQISLGNSVENSLEDPSAVQSKRQPPPSKPKVVI